MHANVSAVYPAVVAMMEQSALLPCGQIPLFFPVRTMLLVLSSAYHSSFQLSERFFAHEDLRKSSCAHVWHNNVPTFPGNSFMVMSHVVLIHDIPDVSR